MYCFYHLSSVEQMQNTAIPDFPHLVNFPAHLHRFKASEGDQEQRRCVMCGKARACSAPSREVTMTIVRSKQKSNDRSRNNADGSSDTVHIIPRQNKGLCTACDVAVWVVKATGVEIKWCKGCKNFRPWVAFGDKGLATKCTRCRDRQREKYALQKEVQKSGGPLSVEKRGPKKSSKSDASTTNQTKNEYENDPSLTTLSPDNHGMSCLIEATTRVSAEKMNSEESKGCSV